MAEQSRSVWVHLLHTLHHLASGLPLFEVHFEGTQRVRIIEKGRV